MISLNYRDARPIYEQIKDGLRHLVVTGAVEPGKSCPPSGPWPPRWPSTPTPSSGPTTIWNPRAI